MGVVGIVLGISFLPNAFRSDVYRELLFLTAGLIVLNGITLLCMAQLMFPRGFRMPPDVNPEDRAAVRDAVKRYRKSRQNRSDQ